ncbi:MULTISPECIES: hemagglutinin [unclassified Microbacterium]|uniref:hemagglutinin n=1 Tax=unclassified Microbacterium TaxID=2609290 RepID=UPI0030100566
MSQIMRRRSIAAGVTGCLVAAFVLGGASAASAADGPYTIGAIPPATPLIPDAGTTELPDFFGNVKELGPLNSSTTKIGVIHDDAVPTLGLTNPNAQVDLRRAWIDTAKDPVTQHDWLYFAWERDSNNGSGFIAFEFMHQKAPTTCTFPVTPENAEALIANCNPWANREAGDFMILWDQQGNSTDLYLRTWSEVNGNLVLGAPGLLDATESAAAYGDNNFKGEAAIDLTAILSDGVPACLVISNVIPSTVTGNSDTADYKDTVLAPSPELSNCEGSVVTTPKLSDGETNVPSNADIGTGILAVKDSAVVDVTGGEPDPAGTVQFFLCKVTGSALCTTGGTDVGIVDVEDVDNEYPVTVVSPTAYVTSAGRYCWRAVYSGDLANGIGGDEDSSMSECFNVAPVTPTLATTAGDDVLLGNAVTDTANLTGLATQPADPVINLTGASGPAAGGTVTFKLYKAPAITGSPCGTLVHTSSATAIVTGQQAGTASATASFPPTSAGSYHWVAEYSGNLPNTNATTHNTGCTDTNEDVNVTSVPSSLTSAQRWVPNDSVTITVPANTGALAGNVDFELYTNGTCSGTPVYTLSNVAVTAAQPTATTANTTAYLATGNFSWRVNYDSTNDAQRDIDWTCHETSALTVSNGGTVSSGP